jgi:hypothetical protein
MRGKALLFKSISVQQTERHTNFESVPDDLDLSDAAGLLEAKEEGQAKEETLSARELADIVSQMDETYAAPCTPATSTLAHEAT